MPLLPADGLNTMDSPLVENQTANGLQRLDSSIVGSLLEQQRKLENDLKRSDLGREVLHQLQTLDRAAFRPQMLKMLLGAPSVADIAAYAAKAPDRYYQALAIVARLNGYSERPEDGVSLSAPFANIAGLSDAEIVEKLKAVDASLQIVAGRAPAPDAIVDADYTVPIDDLM